MQPINVNEYEPLAQARMEPAAWDYFQGGSGDEITLRANRAIFERIRLRPRMLVDVSAIDTTTTALGVPISMPVLIAPSAYHCLAHPEGECATARAAHVGRTIMICSSFASRSLEDVAASNGPLWLQLYIYRSLELSASIIRRAEAAGYRAIVLTVDAPLLSNRERDIRNNFNLPPHVKMANYPTEHRASYIAIPETKLTWDTVDWLRSITNLPILLKGILTAEDALLAVAHRAAGIVVSNHGGRQLDTAITSIEALPEIAAAVSNRCEIYVDGGIRRGTDIVKALALGARAVLIGRPALWGLAVNGEAGVSHILELLRAELSLTMALSGKPTLSSIDNSLVQWIST